MEQETLPKIDAHTHLYRDRAYLADLLAAWRMKVVVINITGEGLFDGITGEGLFDGSMAARWEAMTALKEKYPDRVALCTSFDPEPVAEPNFAERVVEKLREDVRRGARMVKVWKDVGLRVRDRDGRFVQIDNPRFQPVWDFLAEEGLPVLAHVAEPRSAWQPLDPKSPHYRYYRDHPQDHLYRRDDVPAWEAIIAARDRWIARNPALTIIGAHLGSMAHDVRLVAERLARYQNFYVDTAERFGDLVTQPTERVRAFFLNYADRILYGTDVIAEAPQPAPAAEAEERAAYEKLLEDHWAYLSGDEVLAVQDKLLAPIRTRALNLPPDVLKKVYFDNAERFIFSLQ